jgi:hypothetical protein
VVLLLIPEGLKLPPLTTERSCWGELSSPADKGTVCQYNGTVNSGQLNMTLSIKISRKKERKRG